VKQFEFHPDAEEELNDETDYYNGESPGLGDDFADAIERIVADVTDNPRLGREFEPGIFRKRSLRFPHWLIYIVHEERLVIVAVAPQKRKPGYWKNRLRSYR
jgi:toxin ParE1/3/4